MIVVLLAGIYLMVASDDVWKGDEVFIIVGFLAIIALFGLQHGVFQPQGRKRRSSPSATEERRRAQPRVPSDRPADRPARRGRRHDRRRDDLLHDVQAVHVG